MPTPLKQKGKKEYDKTWYYSFNFGRCASPVNWISGRPVKIFGIFIGVLWKLAKPNYPWSDWSTNPKGATEAQSLDIPLNEFN